MDDPVYAEKYADGAEKGDLLGKAKQAFDARHTRHLGGLYGSGGYQYRPEGEGSLPGAEVGYEVYAQNWLTARGSLALYSDGDQGYGGLDLGLRVQPPTRIAPFAGIGIFNGVSRGDRLATNDHVDNDDDDLVDEPGERESFLDGWLAAVYPEVGVHAWVNGSVRVSGYGRYFITSDGRDSDHWLIGGQVTFFTRGN